MVAVDRRRNALPAEQGHRDIGDFHQHSSDFMTGLPRRSAPRNDTSTLVIASRSEAISRRPGAAASADQHSLADDLPVDQRLHRLGGLLERVAPPDARL